MTTRRMLLGGVASSLCLSTLCRSVHAQARPKRIGVLSGGEPPSAGRAHPFADGMRSLGYVEGRDFVVDWRFARGKYDLFASFADELVHAGVDVIVALNTRAAIEAQRATKTTPIVFASISDPLGSGLVSNLAHPGGNTTGISVGLDDTIAKHLDLMRTTVQPLSRLALLINPDNPLYKRPLDKLQILATSLGVSVTPVRARSVDEFHAGFAAMRSAGMQAALVFDDSLFVAHGRELADAAIAARMPALAGNREYAAAGLLYSYGGQLGEQFRRADYYVDKILHGENPGDLPVEQPTRFFFVVNRGTARALGLVLPQELMLRADEVIE